MPSVLATLPGCRTECPGCAHRSFTREESLAQKEQFLREWLAPYAALIEPIRSEDEAGRYHFRDRSVLTAEWDPPAQQWKLGFREKKKDPKNYREIPPVVDISSCPVHSERLRRLHVFLIQALPSPEIFPLAFAAFNGPFLTLVVKAKRDKIQEQVLTSLRRFSWENFGLQGVLVDFHPSAGDRVFSSSGQVVSWGEERAVRAGLQIHASSFSQLLPKLHAQSLDRAFEFLVGPNSRLDAALDLYCGVGSSLIRWGDIPVAGVESSRASLECAKRNAPRAQLWVGKCEDRIPQLREWLRGYQSVGVYVNPPRTGLEPKVLEFLMPNAEAPTVFQKIAYLSCNPVTLRRDIDLLVGSGRYEIESIVPFDFFPHAQAVETLVCLRRPRVG